MNCRKLLPWILVGMPFASPAVPPDVIFVNGYEPGVTVAFTGEKSALMTGAGQSHTFTVQLLDEFGQPAAGEAVEWHLSAGSGLTLSNIQDRSVTVTADNFAIGSAQLWAIHKGSGARAAASVLQGALQTDAHCISSDWVLEGTSGTPEILLVRNAQTEAFAAGQVIVSGDQAGILVRILSASPEADGVRLTVEPAQLTDAFAELSVDVASAPTRLSVSLSDDPATKAASAGLIQKNLSEDLECMTGSSSAIGFDLTGPTIDMNFDVSTKVTLEISGGAVQQFSLAAVAATALDGDMGMLEFSSSVTGNVLCTFQLPEIFSPPLPVSAFSFQLNVAPVVGFEAEATFSGPSFTFKAPKLTVVGRAEAGIGYLPADGWASRSDIDFDGVVQPQSPEFAALAFKVKGGPFATAQMGLMANLGAPPLGIQLADLRFVELKALGGLEFEIKSPLNVNHKDYLGPQWDVDAKISGDYKAELADGALFLALDALGLPTSIDALTGPIFDPIKIPLARSPTVNLEVDCVPACTVDPDMAESALMTITSDDEGTGLATFVAAMDGGTILNELASATFENGQAEATWTPGVADTGSYQVYPRLVTDTLSQFFPYAGEVPQTVLVGNQAITPTDQRFTVGLSASASGQTPESFEIDSDEPVSAGAAAGGAQANASANREELNATASATVSDPALFASAQASAEYHAYPVYFNFGATPVEVTQEFVLSGDYQITDDALYASEAWVNVTINLCGESVQGQAYWCNRTPPYCETYLSTGVLAGYSGGDRTITVGPVTVAPDAWCTWEAQVTSSAVGIADADFRLTLPAVPIAE